MMPEVKSVCREQFGGAFEAEGFSRTGVHAHAKQFRRLRKAVVDLGYRGVDDDNPGVEIIHHGKYKLLTKTQRKWLKRRQAIEPAIGHLKSDNRLDRCHLQGQLGDTLHAVLCAAGSCRRTRRT